MRLVRSAYRAVNRNLWRRSEGLIYYREPIAKNDSPPLMNEDHLLSELDAAEIVSTHEWSYIDESEEHRRRERGDRCFGVKLDNEVVHLIWIASGTNLIRGADLLITLNDNEWYIYGVVTKPSARGKGIYKQAQLQILHIAHDHGIKKMVAYVEKSNPIPQKLYQRLNYELLPLVASHRILSMRFGNQFDSANNIVRPLVIGTSESRQRWI